MLTMDRKGGSSPRGFCGAGWGWGTPQLAESGQETLGPPIQRDPRGEGGWTQGHEGHPEPEAAERKHFLEEGPRAGTRHGEAGNRGAPGHTAGFVSAGVRGQDR